MQEAIMIYIYPQAESFSLCGSGDTVLLFIHGFTASPSELYPTARLIHDLYGCTLSVPLLPDHGSNPRFFNRTNWEQWYAAVEKELGCLMETYSRVFAGGLYMGALLALHAACLVPGLKGAIAINTPIFTHSPVLIAASPLIRHVRPFFPKRDCLHLRDLEEQGRFAYDVIPVKALQSVTKLRDLVVRELHKIKPPVLLVQFL